MSIVSGKPLLVVGARPAPGVHRAPQRKPHAIDSFDQLRAAHSTDCFAENLTADSRPEAEVGGENVCGCHR